MNFLEVIVGVNKYVSKESDPIQALAIDHNQVRVKQLEKLKKLKAARNTADVKRCLDNLREAASSSDTSSNKMDRNLLKLAVDAAKARCTVGEISKALEDAWGRYVPDSHVVSGAYISSYRDPRGLEKFKKKIKV